MIPTNKSRSHFTLDDKIQLLLMNLIWSHLETIYSYFDHWPSLAQKGSMCSIHEQNNQNVVQWSQLDIRSFHIELWAVIFSLIVVLMYKTKNVGL